jgi:hypothetical protein
LADVGMSAEHSIANHHEFSSGKGDINCVNCALLKVELQTVSQELKSVRRIIALLQEDMNTLPGNAGPTNTHKNEGLFSLVNSKSWKKAVVYLNKQTPNFKKFTPPALKIANHFEVLHNLIDEGLQEPLIRKRPSTQFCTNNSDRRNKQTHKNDLTYPIPVIINKGRMPVETNMNMNNKFKRSAQHNQGWKMVIIGDSYAQGCAPNMKHSLKDSYKINGFVKPGACVDTLITSVIVNT